MNRKDLKNFRNQKISDSFRIENPDSHRKLHFRDHQKHKKQSFLAPENSKNFLGFKRILRSLSNSVSKIRYINQRLLIKDKKAEYGEFMGILYWIILFGILLLALGIILKKIGVF